MRRTFHCCLFLLLAIVLAAGAFGQTSSSTTATIHGKVTNQSGAPLANAEVSAVGTFIASTVSLPCSSSSASNAAV